MLFERYIHFIRYEKKQEFCGYPQTHSNVSTERQKIQNSQNNTEKKKEQKLEDRHYSTLILTIKLEQ